MLTAPSASGRAPISQTVLVAKPRHSTGAEARDLRPLQAANDDQLVAALRQTFDRWDSYPLEHFLAPDAAIAPPPLPSGALPRDLTAIRNDDEIPRFLLAARPDAAAPDQRPLTDVALDGLSSTLMVSRQTCTKASTAFGRFCRDQHLGLFWVAGILAGAFLVGLELPAVGRPHAMAAIASPIGFDTVPRSGSVDLVTDLSRPRATAILSGEDRAGLSRLLERVSLDAPPASDLDRFDRLRSFSSAAGRIDFTALNTGAGITRVEGVSRGATEADSPVASAHLERQADPSLALRRAEPAPSSVRSRPHLAAKSRPLARPNATKAVRHVEARSPVQKRTKVSVGTVSARKSPSNAWPVGMRAPATLQEAMDGMWAGK